MNPITDIPHAPQVHPLQPPRSSFSCERHANENVTGFCPSCLCERLTTLDQSATGAGGSSSSRRNSTSTASAAIKAIFAPVNRSSFLPELRRTKSFSASKHEGFGVATGVYEPQRKSCDVRNTLSSLFSIHDENKQQSVLGTNREDIREEIEEVEINNFKNDNHCDDVDEIRVSVELLSNDLSNIVEKNEDVIKEKDDVFLEKDDVIGDILVNPKENIDLESKKPSRSNFWSAASVLSKKWQKWRRKQKKDVSGKADILLTSALPVEKPMRRQYRETQSEIADYGYGRRSCDTDPRFSLDAGRVSFDDLRYSFDEPRASWDGYLIGRTYPRLPPMVEDAPHVPHLPTQVQHVPTQVQHVPLSDMQIPIEETLIPEEDENIPGGSIQTREYYLDSSSKRRKSLDRSNSIRKMAAAVVAELDETKVKPVVVSKVSPGVIDYNHVHNEPPRVSNSNSLRDDCSETFELGFRDSGVGVGAGGRVLTGGGKNEIKKPRRWKWKLWGFIHRRGKDDDEDRYSSVSGVGRSYSESWQDGHNSMNYGINGAINGGIDNRKVFRSNSSISWRSSSLRKTNGNMSNGKVIGSEQVFERNLSARYSLNHIDNGLLRFYLAPLSGSQRGGVGIATGKSRGSGNNSHSIARSMLRLY